MKGLAGPGWRLSSGWSPLDTGTISLVVAILRPVTVVITDATQLNPACIRSRLPMKLQLLMDIATGTSEDQS